MTQDTEYYYHLMLSLREQNRERIHQKHLQWEREKMLRKWRGAFPDPIDNPRKFEMAVKYGKGYY